MPPKILIVDDEAYIRLLIEQTLEELEDKGVELLTAENGAEALEIIKKEKPELVFLDVMMPVMNGYDVCKKVKRDLNIANVHIVLLTARGVDFASERDDSYGADLYMGKPFDPDDVLKHANEVLGLK